MIIRWLAALCCIVLLASAARAQGVDLELVLAVDSSGGIDDDEFALQRLGYARAPRQPDVLAAIARGPHRGLRRVIDISGDGPTNRGPWPEAARDAAVARGVTINGLAIVDFDDGLVEHFHDTVIGGPGAFVLTAAGFDDFARAVIKKLLQELNLAAAPPS